MILFPTADEIAVAIVAACRETKEDPFAITARSIDSIRARHYALHALLHVFQRASRTALCLCVGCPGKPSAFWNASWNGVAKPKSPGSMLRQVNWWDEAAFERVIRAIEAEQTRRAVMPTVPQKEPEIAVPEARCDLAGTSPKRIDDAAEREEPTVEVASYVEPPPYRPPPDTVRKVLANDAGERPFRGFRQGRGTLEPNGYRPPPNTIRDIVADDNPVFDSGDWREKKPFSMPSGQSSKSNLYEELRRAAANTAALPIPKDEN